jgi:hypothetical protein
MLVLFAIDGKDGVHGPAMLSMWSMFSIIISRIFTRVNRLDRCLIDLMIRIIKAHIYSS